MFSFQIYLLASCDRTLNSLLRFPCCIPSVTSPLVLRLEAETMPEKSADDSYLTMQKKKKKLKRKTEEVGIGR